MYVAYLPTYLPRPTYVIITFKIVTLNSKPNRKFLPNFKRISIASRTLNFEITILPRSEEKYITSLYFPTTKRLKKERRRRKKVEKKNKQKFGKKSNYWKAGKCGNVRHREGKN